MCALFLGWQCCSFPQDKIASSLLSPFFALNPKLFFCDLSKSTATVVFFLSLKKRNYCCFCKGSHSSCWFLVLLTMEQEAAALLHVILFYWLYVIMLLLFHTGCDCRMLWITSNRKPPVNAEWTKLIWTNNYHLFLLMSSPFQTTWLIFSISAFFYSQVWVCLCITTDVGVEDGDVIEIVTMTPFRDIILPLLSLNFMVCILKKCKP